MTFYFLMAFFVPCFVAFVNWKDFQIYSIDLVCNYGSPPKAVKKEIQDHCCIGCNYYQSSKIVSDKVNMFQDSVYPFLIGVIEMLSYPFLMISDNWLYIGAWLTFKTVHRYSYSPEEKRGKYNRYLFGNAIVILGSFLSVKFATDFYPLP